MSLTRPSTSWSHTVAELRRRRVFRAAAIYAAVAFVVWQAADIAAPALHLPEWTMTLIVLLAIVGFPLAIVLAWIFDVTAPGIERTVATEAAAAPSLETSPADDMSLAVLPFANTSADPENEYFADGLTEELISDLAQVRALRVTSRTSSMALKGSTKGVREIGRELGVRYLMEGGVRRAGSALRITAQLIDARTDAQLWAEAFDGATDDVFEIQAKVARAIVEALRIHLSPGEARALADRPIPDVRAHDAYLRARYEAWRFSAEGLERAQLHIETALAIVGDNELLYSTLGHIWAMYFTAGIDPDPAALERVDRLAEKVFVLEPDSARGHWLKAFVALHRGDLRGAIVDGERANALAPDDADTLVTLGYVYAHAGRNDEARACFARGVELDPLTPLTQAMPGFAAIMEGRFADGVDAYGRFYEMDPDGPFSAVCYGWSLAYARRFDEAYEVLDRAAGRFPGTALASWADSLARALRGEPDAARAITPVFEAAGHGNEMFARELAHSYALSGETERALDWLERAVALGMMNHPFLTEHDWLLDGVRGEPRFEVLMERVREESARLASVSAVDQRTRGQVS